MNTKNLINQMSYGELSNLSLSNSGNGSIKPSEMKKILTFVNEGMVMLFTKYNLMEKDVLIKLENHITEYHLLKRFAESSQPVAGVDFAYIKDNDREPFKEDVLKILSVYDNYGIERKINDDNSMNSVYVKQNNVLMVPHPETGIFLSIAYQARNQEITVDELDQEIDLHVAMIPLLKAYVAFKVYSSMNTQEMQQKSIEYLNLYVNLCNEHETRDFTNESPSVFSSNFSAGGWV